jgi:hypothetical protein
VTSGANQEQPRKAGIVMAPGAPATLLPLVLYPATTGMFRYKFGYQLLTRYLPVEKVLRTFFYG